MPFSSLSDASVVGTLVALGVGLLIGIERERRKADPHFGGAGGVRTHVIVALAGALAMQFPGFGLVIVGGVFVAALVLLAYAGDRSPDIGITSEITLFTTYLLGAVATLAPEFAAAVGVVIALLLALRKPLHRLAGEVLNDQELLDFLLLAAAVLVVLPLMPAQPIDRYGVVNLKTLWTLAVLVLALNAAGYVALRALGPSRGLPIAGLFGGFVSSSATIASLGGVASRTPALLRAAAAGAVLSCIATAVQVLLVLAVVRPELLREWWLPALAMAAVNAVYVVAVLRRGPRETIESGERLLGRALQPTQALIFSVTVTAVLWGAAWLDERYGALGAVWGIALSGFADAHSATASAGTLAAQGHLNSATAVLAIVLALGTNALSKLVVAGFTGGRRYLARVAPAVILSLAAAALVLWLAR